MDTLELFKIAFPTDKSYQLSALAESHHIPLIMHIEQMKMQQQLLN